MNMRTAILVLALAVPLQAGAQTRADLLLLGGSVLDGAGNPWVRKDIAITSDRITFVGNARVDKISARDTLDVRGLVVTPGLWDVHSHAELGTDWGNTRCRSFTRA
jgi:N-acyl-D-aspartate/D-glutamate deacylase